ncbi:MAG: AIR synthase-related protein, partial [Rhodospirillaceae bacterium]
LTPTRMYVKPCLAAIRAGGVHALAHITGGGLTENLPRVFPDGLGAVIDGAAWTPPPVFGWLKAAGGIATDEMLRTFNCGIGMAVIVAPDRAEALKAVFAEAGETAVAIGRIGPADGGEPVAYANPEALWRN